MSQEAVESTPAGAAEIALRQKILPTVTPEMLAKYDAATKAWSATNPTPDLQRQNMASKPKSPYPTNMPPAPGWHYNAMIHGLQPYTLRGVIWFQADGNGNVRDYSELFQAFIEGWRADWKEQLPFFFVEMNNRSNPQTKPVELNNMSLLREQQHGGLLQPAVGMAVSINVGINNPHFPNKKPVGERLAGLALRECYGQKTGEVESPMFKSFSIESNRIRLSFTHAEGLRTRGGSGLKGFAIRGSSGDWVWATAMIDGETIVVWSDQVTSPAAVRYAWAQNPITSVENGAGLPLVPFRTDTASRD